MARDHCYAPRIETKRSALSVLFTAAVVVFGVMNVVSAFRPPKGGYAPARAASPGAPLPVCAMEFVPSVTARDPAFGMDASGTLFAEGPVLARVVGAGIVDEGPEHLVSMEVGVDDRLYGQSVPNAKFVGDDLLLFSEDVRFRMGDDGKIERLSGKYSLLIGYMRATPDCLRRAKRTALLVVQIALARPLPIDDLAP